MNLRYLTLIAVCFAAIAPLAMAQTEAPSPAPAAAAKPAAATPAAAPAVASSAADINGILAEFKQHYDAQHYGKAAAKLTQAAEVLLKYKASRMAAYLPPAPPGWMIEKDAVTGDNIMGGGASVSRTYAKAGQKIELNMMSDNPMINGLMGLANMPGADGGFETYKGYKLKFEAARTPTTASKAMLVIDSNLFLNLEGVGMDRGAAMSLLDAINVAELAKLSAM